jgi:hypothetical protein
MPLCQMEWLRAPRLATTGLLVFCSDERELRSLVRYLAHVEDVSKFSIVLGPNGCSNHSKTSVVSAYHNCAAAANAGMCWIASSND